MSGAGQAPHTRVALSRQHYDAVIFDMDGVVTDTAQTHFVAWKRTFDDFLAQTRAPDGQPERPFDRQDYLAHVDGKARLDGVETFLASRGLTLPRGEPSDDPGSSTAWGVANRKNEMFRQALDEEGVRTFPSAVALVRDLQAAGFGTAVVTASRNAEQVLEVAGLGRLFPVRVDGVESARLSLPGKPSPAAFLEAARRLEVSPNRAVVVEDAVSGAQAGHDGGFGLVIGVADGANAEALTAAGADVVLDDLAGVRVLR